MDYSVIIEIAYNFVSYMALYSARNAEVFGIPGLLVPLPEATARRCYNSLQLTPPIIVLRVDPFSEDYVQLGSLCIFFL